MCLLVFFYKKTGEEGAIYAENLEFVKECLLFTSVFSLIENGIEERLFVSQIVFLPLTILHLMCSLVCSELFFVFKMFPIISL